MNTTNKGKVVIIGAGPGDPDLITIKAVQYLQKANVVLVDRLVSEVILKRYVNPNAIIIPVGKQCRYGLSTAQGTINTLLIQYANTHALVVRLKGGDVSFFSNVLDELEVLKNQAIPFEIVPGITAASGAAAYAGIPLTARNYATAIRFLTYYKTNIITDSAWHDLAITNDTLVWYMSSETLEPLIEQLRLHGIDEQKWVSVIEQATTPLQQVYSAPIRNFLLQFGTMQFLSPSLVIIGRVASLSQQFNWFNGENTQQSLYFPQVTATAEPYLHHSLMPPYVSRT
ncbi:uroporphyrinogen-III C-methyltransferase [Hydrotalea sp.]|uniref:uroporphyrinogen-III C-methyltransferase n=1 Tax=Hydrotalea sp. TaxID=2881279 RepID=UPI00262D9F4E|nr:uroporphyrinogen-III C-methyltransferase [Hydrotalea sp.]